MHRLVWWQHFRKLGPWLTRGVRAWSLSLLLLHFALTVIYVAPINPVKIALQPIVYGTIGQYFAQNWSFFAPNPISSNISLLVRPLDPVEAKLDSHDLPAGEWYDLTSPFWSRFQGNRFSAYERLSRPQANAMRMYMGGSPELGPWIDACHKGDQDACRFYEREMQKFREHALEVLVRIASGFVTESFPNHSNFTHVALRVRSQIVVPWSQRFHGKPAISDMDLGIYAIVDGVASSGIYQHVN